MEQKLKTAFIIGSPRSGTTIMGNILDAHPEAAHIYEPYYIWYYYAKDLSTDFIPPEDIGPEELKWIRRQFEIFASRMGQSLVIDKSPEHSFNLPILNAAFPHAKYIHMLRDGRDVVLSMKKEWKKRRTMVETRNFLDFVRTASTMLKRQPLWRFRALALWYELKTNFSLVPSRYLNKAKWQGQIGWGPRFKGWHETLSSEPLIRFHAYQWLHCITQIQEDLPLIPKENVLEVRYEDLVSDKYEAVLRSITDFLELSFSPAFLAAIPEVRRGNSDKWLHELSAMEIKQMGPVLADELIELGYDNDRQWYEALA